MDTCPRCGGNLEAGFVTTGGREAIIWSATALRLLRRPPKPGPDYQLLHAATRRPPNIPALRCTQCQLALMDYSRS